MGNAIQKKFDVPKEHTATAGHMQLWKIWPGKNKETGQLTSIWAFDKNELSKKRGPSGNSLYDKAMIEQIYQIMKKDLTVIKESQNCPNLISSLEVNFLFPIMYRLLFHSSLPY